MSEGTLQEQPTDAADGAPVLSAAETAGDAYSAAYDRLADAARAVHGHMLGGELVIAAETYAALKELSDAVAAFDEADAQLMLEAKEYDHAGEPDAPALPEGSELWRQGFESGAKAQLEHVRRYASGRGWVSMVGALQLLSPVEPTPTTAATEVTTTMAGDTHEA